MTATHWLLAAIIALCIMGLVAVVFCKMINTEWSQADEPIYRTADGGVLSADARTALRNASNFDAPAPAAINPNMQTTRREGTAAAIRDMGRKPGTPATPNPHTSDTLAHFAWRDSYDRASSAIHFKATP